jgi:hypothetical protein
MDLGSCGLGMTTIAINTPFSAVRGSAFHARLRQCSCYSQWPAPGYTLSSLRDEATVGGNTVKGFRQLEFTF